jgi:hypothetical protein
MGNLLKSSGRHLSGGWFSFWAAALLILPNCGFSTPGLPDINNFDPGTPPHTGAIFCDIERARRCATPEDLAMGTRLASAAVALVAGQPGTMIGIDDSPAALASCSGSPVAIVFEGSFPQGLPVCVNCGETIPIIYPDTDAACQVRCHDLFGAMAPDGSFRPTIPPTADTIAFCAANARASTNVPLNGCFEDACTTAGTLLLDFADPRRIPEPVDWINLNGVSAAGGTLTRTAPTTGFSDAGASSSQLIAGGDAYLEFTATETNTARTAGLSSGPPPPGGITFNDIDFGLLLLLDEILVVENGPAVSNFGLYAAGSKFRVKLRDNFDGTATVSYARITGPCVDGAPCNETVFHTSANPATYPVRVDAMFREQGGTITEARIARIR